MITRKDTVGISYVFSPLTEDRVDMLAQLGRTRRERRAPSDGKEAGSMDASGRMARKTADMIAALVNNIRRDRGPAPRYADRLSERRRQSHAKCAWFSRGSLIGAPLHAETGKRLEWGTP